MVNGILFLNLYSNSPYVYLLGAETRNSRLLNSMLLIYFSWYIFLLLGIQLVQFIVTMMKKENEVPKKFLCELCSLGANVERDLNNHAKAVHAQINEQICEDCGAAYSSKHGLNLHIKAVHLKIKDHLCQLCPYKTSHSGALTLHVRAVHAKIRDHTCLQCGATFSSLQNFKTHEAQSVANHLQIHLI